MVSNRQIEANKRNAQRSTGPKTKVGKSRSRLNARKHGLTSKMLIIVGECADEFDELRAELLEQFDPQSAFECELVERVAGLLWRLRRMPFFEAAILDARQATVTQDMRIDAAFQPRREYAQEEGEGDNDEDDETSDLQHSIYIGRSLIKDGRSGDVLGKLSRYETTLMNNLRKTLQMLEEARHGVRGDGVIIDAVPLPAESGNKPIAA